MVPMLQVLDTLKCLTELRCVYLRGNPVVSAIPQYRRTLLAALPGLTYLDDRPVFPTERRCAEAWRAQPLLAERIGQVTEWMPVKTGGSLEAM